MLPGARARASVQPKNGATPMCVGPIIRAHNKHTRTHMIVSLCVRVIARAMHNIFSHYICRSGPRITRTIYVHIYKCTCCAKVLPFGTGVGHASDMFDRFCGNSDFFVLWLVWVGFGWLVVVLCCVVYVFHFFLPSGALRPPALRPCHHTHTHTHDTVDIFNLMAGKYR